MSKHSRKKHRKRAALRRAKAVAVICQRCGQTGDGSAGTLLTSLADAMNACSDAGLDVRLRHGVVLAAGKTGGGYVLPLPAGDGDRWTARTLTFDPFIAVPGHAGRPG